MGQRELDEAKQQLRESGLDFPPVPTEFVDAFEHYGPWNWGTLALNSLEMYIFEFPWPRDPLEVPPDYVAVSHGGHGVNSYTLNYHLVFRPIIILFQIGWGGVYSDSAQDAQLFKRQCELAAGLVDEAQRIRTRGTSPGELGIIVASDLRNDCRFEAYDASGRLRGEETLTYSSFSEVELAYERATIWLTRER